MRGLEGTVSCGSDPMLEQGECMRSPSLEDEGAGQTMGDELAAAPIPCRPAPLTGRRYRFVSKIRP